MFRGVYVFYATSPFLPQLLCYSVPVSVWKPPLSHILLHTFIPYPFLLTKHHPCVFFLFVVLLILKVQSIFNLSTEIQWKYMANIKSSIRSELQLISIFPHSFQITTLLPGLFHLPDIVFLDAAGIICKESVGDLQKTVFLSNCSLLRHIPSKEYHNQYHIAVHFLRQAGGEGRSSEFFQN